ncbi:hypothetical protein [uncultured Agrobacterium sp.]|uniref:hypothetical protein n=1 Tax=uncultured Agrobacterium sp. TaxID=157277 RepID=UPI0025EAF69F|nr:hypothetical protein [uncultured Agrobacterium sp.]
MKRSAVGAAALFLLSTTTAVLAQTYEVSSVIPSKKPSLATVTRQAMEDVRPHYIVDVAGKRVRLIGPRFYPDNSSDVELMGRNQALEREAGHPDMSFATAAR